MKPHLIAGLSALLLAHHATAQTVLMDFNDGDPDNGIHDANLRGGGFDDVIASPGVDSSPFANHSFWFTVGATQTGEATRTNIANNGAKTTGSIRSAVLTGTRTFLNAITTSGYTITPGDTYSISFVWRDAASWSADGRISMQLGYYSSEGAPGFDPATATFTSFATFLTEPSTTTATWEEAASDFDQAPAPAAASGKTLHLRMTSTSTAGFGRADNITLTVTQAVVDPRLVTDTGSFHFGTLFHANASATTSRTVTFANTGDTRSLTIEGVQITDTAGGVFSVTGAPANGTVIPPGGTFDVTVTATGGSGWSAIEGALSVDVSHSQSPANDQDLTIPLTATIATTGDPFPIINNGGFESLLTGWTGSATSTTGLVSTSGARLRGAGDNRANIDAVFAANLGQLFKYSDSPDFDLKLFFTLPDFTEWSGLDPEVDRIDRSFHLAILADPPLPTTGTFNSTHARNTLINLFYLPAGRPGSPTPGFYLYDGGAETFVHVPELGTLATSTAFNADGSPPTDSTVYQLKIHGRNFGTPSANYSITISQPNSTTVAATAAGLTTYQSVNPTEATAKALVLTTNDSDSDPDNPTNQTGGIQTTFWVDNIEVNLVQTLPLALFQLTKAPLVAKVHSGSAKTTSFTVSNVGFGADLTLANPLASDPRFSLSSPAFPASIPVGQSLLLDLAIDASTIPGDASLAGTLNLTTNDAIQASRPIPVSALVLAGGRRILIDYDDGIPGNGIHEASIRNGGFEDGTAGDDFVKTPNWFARFSPEGDSSILTLDESPATGALHGTTSGFGGTGARAHPTQTFSPDEWTLEEGDFMTVEVTWKDGPGFTQPSSIQVLIEVLDANGTIINSPTPGIPSSRLLEFSTPLIEPGVYQTNTVTSRTVAVGDPWIGGRPFFRILNNGTRQAFAYIDNITLIGHIKPLPVLDMAITAFNFNPATNQITLRWNDIGTGYVIQASGDLDFSTGVTGIPVDGTADTTTFPGEIEFSFIDPTGGSRRFWRVATD